MVVAEIFGIGGGELVVLLVLGVIMFGPEKLPEISRKAARFIYAFKVIADQATEHLKEELGPEYADLTLADLNPKTFVKKQILADLEGDLDDIKKDLSNVKKEFTSTADIVKEVTGKKTTSHTTDKAATAEVEVDSSPAIPDIGQTTVVEASTPPSDIETGDCGIAHNIVGSIPYDNEAT